jgi:hypothetical protein
MRVHACQQFLNGLHQSFWSDADRLQIDRRIDREKRLSGARQTLTGL